MGEVLALIYTYFTYAAAAYTVYSAVQAQQDQKAAEKKAKEAAADRNARRNYRAATPAVTLAYGKNRVAGPFMFIQNTSTRKPVLFVAFIKTASHEIEEFTNFYLDEEEITVPPGGGEVTEYKYGGTVKIFPFMGTEDQDVGAKLIELGCTDVLASDTFAGQAGFVVWAKNLTKNFPDTAGNFAARFKGAKVDTGGENPEYSTNPAWCAVDYLKRFQGVTDAEIDADTLAASVATCDELVSVKGGGTQKRYEANGVLLLTGEDHRDNLKALADCMAGDIVYSSGKWFIEAGKWREPEEGEDYQLRDIAGEVEINLEPRAEDRPNIVKGLIYSPDHHDEEIEFPSVEFTREDGEPERILDLPLALVNDYRQAQRIAKIRGNQARAAMTASLPLRVVGLKNRPGDVCRYKLPRLGSELLTARISSISRVMEQSEEGMKYRVTHSIASAASTDYDWDAETEEGDLPISALEFSTAGALIPVNVAADETSVAPSGDPPSGGSTDVVVTWEDPEGGLVELECIMVRLLDGGTEVAAVEVAAGVETYTFNEDYLTGPLTVGLRAKYDDNSTSGEVTATAT